MTNILKKFKHKLLLVVSPGYKREHEKRVARQRAIVDDLHRSKEALIVRIEELIERQFTVLRRLRANSSRFTPPGMVILADELQRKIAFNQARLRALKENRKSYEINISEYMQTVSYLLDSDKKELDSVGMSDKPPFFPIPRKTDSHP